MSAIYELMEAKKEITQLKRKIRRLEAVKVYVVNADSSRLNFYGALETGQLDAIKRHAKKHDSVYTLQEFQVESNCEELSLSNKFILID
jgi:hypothetical protein